MSFRQAELFRTAFVPAEILDDPRPAIGFLGRSNVGKSSLINRLLNQRNLARTSSTPGKTLSINYYLVNHEYFFIDLPGYGYARTSKREVQRVRRLMDAFFAVPRNLRLLVHLIDSRRGFLDSDLDVLGKIIDREFPILTVLTKSDKLGSSALKHQVLSLRDRFQVKAVPFSVKSESCRKELEIIIEEALKERQ